MSPLFSTCLFPAIQAGFRSGVAKPGQVGVWKQSLLGHPLPEREEGTEHPTPLTVNPRLGGIVWRRKRMSRKKEMSGGEKEEG